MDMSSSDENAEPDRTSESAPFPLAPGTLVSGIYRLVRQLGAGGMGQVWEARHERTKGRVAVKVLLPEMGRHEEVLRRFQREVEVTSALNHPNIVRVSDADELPDGRPYLVMEFLDGYDLTTVAGRALPLAEVIDIIEQTAMGLHVAHGQSVIHRDLKPANIFVVPLPGTSRAVVKVLDFGISKAMDGVNRLTQTRNVIGTPYYMAPEQATGGRSAMDARADQFSLAAIAYELCTGQMAFAGDGMMNIIYKVVNDPPRSFASLGVTAPAGVEAAILRALSKSPNDRFPSVMEFAEALKQPGAVTIADARAVAITATMRAMPGTLILPAPSSTTATLRSSTGQIATAAEIVPAPRRVPPPTPRPTARAFGRGAIVAIAGGAAIAAAAVAVLVVRGDKSDPASSHPSMVSPAAPAAPAPRPAPPKDPGPAAPPARPEPEGIGLPQQPMRPPVVDLTRPRATPKPKATPIGAGPSPVADSPTGGIKAPAPRRAVPRVGPLNGDL